MKQFLKRFYAFTKKLIDSIVSLICVILFSRHENNGLSELNREIADKSSCTILGNGPSLKESIKLKKGSFNRDNTIVVNNFCNDPYFFDLKPRMYIVIDPAYYRNYEQSRDAPGFFEKMTKVDWEMYLIVPFEFKENGVYREINNPSIKYIYINLTPVSGFKWLSRFLYKHNLGMPQSQNVLNAAIFCGINMGFKEIRVYGADHSWSKDVAVYKNNKVCYVEDHFYDKEKTYHEMEGFTISSFFLALSKAFDSHMKLRGYADSCGCMIINCTPESFIDAYEREEL